jgi:hypothetical protein
MITTAPKIYKIHYNVKKIILHTFFLFKCYQTCNHKILKAYRLSELNFFAYIKKVANIRCFILIECSEQEVRFKKCYNVVISEKNSNVCRWNRH